MEVAISRLPSGGQEQAGAGTSSSGAGGAQPGFAKGGTAARLLVGSCHDDRLLLMKSMVVETFSSPFTVRQGPEFVGRGQGQRNGSCHDDHLLLLLKSMVVETSPSPFTVRWGQRS